MDYELKIDVLKKVMEERGLTNQDVANILQIKTATFIRYLNGKGHPHFVHLGVLSRRLEIDVFDLMILDLEEIKKIRDMKANKSAHK